MRRLKFIFLILFLSSGTLILDAQDNDELMIGLRAGHYSSFGGFAALSVETTQTFCKNFSINGGVQYNTIGKTSLEARPAYNMPFEWGKFSVESVLTYSYLSSVNNFTAGAGVSVDSRYVGARLGYYYRLYGGRGSRIMEPFNLYYEFRAHFLQNIDKWNLDLVISNCEIFELDRHYQPSFIAECNHYPTGRLGISFGVGCKPSGIFHISAGYYQSYIKTGLCYRW